MSTSRLVRWLFLWFILYGAGVLLYNWSYPFTREALIHNLQVKPAAWLIEKTLPGHAVSYDEASIYTGPSVLYVMRGCDGIETWLLLFTALAVFPMSWKKRLRSVLYGTVLVFFLNLLRIVTLFHIMIRKPAWMETAHGIVWQSIMVLSVVMYVFIWMEPAPERGQAT